MSDLKAWDFDIDHYLNRFVPRNRVHLLPKPISWFLGYRETPSPRIGSVLVWFWAFLGALLGLLVVEAVFQTQRLKSEGAPIVIASLGAAAIVEYHTIDGALSQPRNAILSQLIASIIGVGITKLFQLSPKFESLRWIAGALSVGLTSAVMGFTKTVHPPAGATALLASTSAEITALGWFFVPLIMLGSTLMLAVACVVNNIQRQFPRYWWTPVEFCGEGDVEKLGSEGGNGMINSEGSFNDENKQEHERIVIIARKVEIPDWIEMDEVERLVLDALRRKLKEGLRGKESRDTEHTRVGRSS